MFFSIDMWDLLAVANEPRSVVGPVVDPEPPKVNGRGSAKNFFDVLIGLGGDRGLSKGS